MTFSKTVSPLLATLFVGSLSGLVLGACDLQSKNIGDSDSVGDSGNDDDTSTCEGPAPDIECATCECEDGEWLCPAIGCGDDGPGTDDGDAGDDDPGGCNPGDEMPAADGCNTCICDDDGMTWSCTALGCGSTGNGGQCEEGDEMPAEDGCNTCTCVDGDWACTEIACESAIPLCTGGEPGDAFTINTASITGDSLDLNVSYSGGCAEHVFDLCWDGAWAESEPVQTGLTVTHDGMMDPCDAFPSEDISLDLSGLRQEYTNTYSPTGTISINLAGYGSIDYSF